MECLSWLMFQFVLLMRKRVFSFYIRVQDSLNTIVVVISGLCALECPPGNCLIMLSH